MKHSILLTLITAILFFCISSYCISSDFYIDAVNGNNANSGTSEDEAWKTISYALTYVVGTEENPALIHVAAGTYNMELGEDFPLNIDSFMWLVGEDRDNTMLDATESDSSVLNCSFVKNVVIEKLTITGGTGTFMPMTEMVAGPLFGGGIFCDSSTIEVKDCKISGNTTAAGGGIFIGLSDVKMTGCEVESNVAVDKDNNGMGGGILILNSEGEIKDCIISANCSPLGAG
ncbi:DUF1565 domain-containing protein, partial [bacterium]|nr:DUF1565 domain-containing protein [bacterium]